jgi:hypothetical protein
MYMVHMHNVHGPNRGVNDNVVFYGTSKWIENYMLSLSYGPMKSYVSSEVAAD